ARPLTSSGFFFVVLGSFFCFLLFLVSDRLLSSAWISALVSDHHFHAAEGGFHRCDLHAHGMGAPRTESCVSHPAAVPAGLDRAHGDRRGLHLADAARLIPALSEPSSAL